MVEKVKNKLFPYKLKKIQSYKIISSILDPQTPC